MCLSWCWVTLSSSCSDNAGVSQRLFCASLLPLQSSFSFCQPNLCYFIPTLLLLDYFTVIIRYQFCATSRIQFTIKSKIMLPIIQIFHILLMVQEHVLSSPSYLGDISPFQHLFPILPFTGKSQTHHWTTNYSTYVHMEFLYSQWLLPTTKT